MEVAHLNTRSTRRSQVRPPRALCPSQEKPLSGRGLNRANGSWSRPPPPLTGRRGHGRAGSGHPGTRLASVAGKPGGGGQASQTALTRLTPAKRLWSHACWPCPGAGSRQPRPGDKHSVLHLSSVCPQEAVSSPHSPGHSDPSEAPPSARPQCDPRAHLCGGRTGHGTLRHRADA